MYVYIDSEPGLWTVGHYAPNGRWLPESDHDSRLEAARRVHYLNGGGSSTADYRIEQIEKRVAALEETLQRYWEGIQKAIAAAELDTAARQLFRQGETHDPND